MDIERLSPNDLMTLASDRGPAPMNIAAVLELERDLGFGAARELLGRRLERVPRLRQRLQRLPPGLGRAMWLDDPTFDLDRHLDAASLRAPNENALLDVAAELACTPFDPRRPMWRARWVDGLPDGRAAIVLALHHVIADGLGGLAALTALSDAGIDPVGPDLFPRERPPVRRLAADARATRRRRVRETAHRVGAMRDGLGELGLLRSRPRLAASTSLTARAAGPTRALDVLTVPLSGVRDAAHRAGGTINDVIVTAIVGAIASTLTRRGERTPAEIVVSVPVARRLAAEPGRIGNETGVRPVTVATIPDPQDRLRQVVTATAGTAGGPRAASAVPLAAVFRALARAGLFRVFIEHQRLVHTFVTNMRGPAEPLSFGGALIAGIIPIASRRAM